LAKLAGGVAVISVGASTESEMKERKARVEDALHVSRAAVKEGVVAGGGVAYLRTQRRSIVLSWKVMRLLVWLRCPRKKNRLSGGAGGMGGMAY